MPPKATRERQKSESESVASADSAGVGAGSIQVRPLIPGAVPRNDVPPEDVIQAVVLADSFNQRFMPLSVSQPKVTLVESKDSLNAGDALREIDRHNLIKSDFILLNADVVSNLDLGSILMEHRARRKTDRNTLMTIVTSRANPGHRTRPGDDGAFVLDRVTNELLHYEPFSPGALPKYLQFSLEGLEGHTAFSIRNDLLDCRIDICSPEVPALMTENFDYADIRRHFVRGILQSDILSSKIFVHIAEKGYAARVESIRTYGAVRGGLQSVNSQDIMMRWSFPLVPDSNFGDTSYSYRRKHVYTEDGVVLARSCIVDAEVVLGRGTTVGANSKICKSVIGRNCRIGENVVIENAYLWDGVVVRDHARISHAIIGHNAEILERTVVSPNCLIAKDVVVGPDIVLSPQTRVSSVRPKPVSSGFSDSEDVFGHPDDEKEPVSAPLDGDFDCGALGAGARGFVWAPVQDEDEESEDDMERFARGGPSDLDPSHAVFRKGTNGATRAAYFAHYELSFADWSSPFLDGSIEAPSPSVDDGSATESESEDDDEPGRGHLTFWGEALDTAKRAILEKHSIDNFTLELGALRLSYNANHTDCFEALLTAMLELSDRQKPVASLKQFFGVYGKVLGSFVDARTDQKFALDAVLADVLEADQIIGWYHQAKWKKPGISENERALHTSESTEAIPWCAQCLGLWRVASASGQAKPLVDRLIELEAEEEEEGDDDDDDQEEEESEDTGEEDDNDDEATDTKKANGSNHPTTSKAPTRSPSAKSGPVRAQSSDSESDDEDDEDSEDDN